MVGKQRMKVRLPSTPQPTRMRERSKEWNRVHRAIETLTRAPETWVYIWSVEQAFGWTHEFMLQPVERGKRVALRLEAAAGWSPDTRR